MGSKPLRDKKGQYAGSIGDGKTPPSPSTGIPVADGDSSSRPGVSQEAFHAYRSAGNPEVTYQQYLSLVSSSLPDSASPSPSVIRQEDCEPGGVYRVKSRNLTVGVYDGNGGFIGLREKFGDLYLFTEYHCDKGAPYGTVYPYEKLDVSTEGLPIVERFTPACRDCGEEVEFEYGETGRGWFHTDSPDTHKANPVGRSNTALFEFLSQFEEEYR